MASAEKATDSTSASRDADLTSSELYDSPRSRIGGHEWELKDRVTMFAYLDAIYKNKHLFEGKTVLDLGCGLGVRSMAAVKSGAKHVYAVDAMAILDKTALVLEANGHSSKITLIPSTPDVKNIKLPIPCVDVIICAWMGQALLFKSTIHEAIRARDRFLAADGIMFPNRARLHLAAADVCEIVDGRVDWWRNVYGYDMTCMQRKATAEPSKLSVRPHQIVTDSCVLHEINVMECSESDASFTAPFALRFRRDGTAHGFVAFFDVSFGFCHTFVGFTTSPYSRHTRFEQTLFYLDKPISCEEGTVISGSMQSLLREKTAKGSGCEFLFPKVAHIKLARPITPPNHSPKRAAGAVEGAAPTATARG